MCNTQAIMSESVVYVFEWIECQVLRKEDASSFCCVKLLPPYNTIKISFFMRQLGKSPKAMHFFFQYMPARNEDYSPIPQCAKFFESTDELKIPVWQKKTWLCLSPYEKTAVYCRLLSVDLF